MKKVLVFAAHPDDEVLGCGGAIARHVNEGDDVYVAFSADGVTSRNDASISQMDERNLSAKEACKILGIKSHVFLGFPDNKMDSVPLLDVVKAVEEVLYKIQPSVIYTHHTNDLNIDHVITHKAVITACRPQPGFFVKEIYAFEVLSSTEWITPSSETAFIPNHYINITSTLNIKLEALKSYNSEIKEYPHSRSFKNVEALATYRGATVGVEYAEAFKLLRSIV